MNRISAPLTVGLLLLAAAGCVSAEHDRFTREWRAKPAPDFELKALDGDVVQLSDYRGQPVLLAFWGHGCLSCHAEAPHLSQLAEEHAKEGLGVLAVNAWNDDPAIVKRFVKRGKLKQRVLLEGEAVAQAYGALSVPMTLWIDRSGVVVDAESGFDAASLAAKTERLVSDLR